MQGVSYVGGDVEIEVAADGPVPRLHCGRPPDRPPLI